MWTVCGVWNDTFLAIFWLFRVGTALRRVEDASLGTLNFSIPSQSEAAYKGKVLGLVESQKVGRVGHRLCLVLDWSMKG